MQDTVRHSLAVHGLLVLLLALAGMVEALAVPLSGRVTDSDGQPLQFVTVYVEGTTIGTTTNSDGNYRLDLKAGYHTVVFRYVGYATEVRPVTVETPTTVDVTMRKIVFELGEAVADGSEDAAYRIMRLARGKREFYQEQVQEYSCKVYVKGVNYVKNLPKRIMGRSLDLKGLDSTRSGIAYLSESLSEYHFKAPNKSKERVIASKVSGNSQGFTWNNATSLQFNFYDRTYSLSGLSSRDLVSPLSPSANLYYRYIYRGFFVEDSIIVNRIELIPKVKGVPLLSGYIFIQENSWRIHGMDVYMTSSAGIEYVDTVRMKVDFIPLTPDLWLKGTLTFDFSFNVKLFKVRGHGTFSSVFSDYSIRKYYRDSEYFDLVRKKRLAQQGIDPASAPPAPAIEPTAKAGGEATKFDFKSWDKGPLVKVESEANDKDETFWETIRTIPLTALEAQDYIRKDSLELVAETRAYKDSLDSKNNRFRANNLIYGWRYQHSAGNWSLHVQSPLTAVHYNTVEGYLIDHRLTFSKWAQDKKKGSGLTAVYHNRYGFSSRTYHGKGSLFYRFNRVSRMRLYAEGGHWIEQFQDGGVSQLLNSLYSIFLQENYAKLYRHSYGKLGWGTEVLNGLHITLRTYYGHRSRLENAPNLRGTHLELPGREFTPNEPVNADLPPAHPAFGSNRALKYTVVLKYRPGQKYWEYPDRKINLGSKWPALSLEFEQGIPIAGVSDADFAVLRLGADSEHRLGMGGELEWQAEGGWFMHRGFVAFADRRHFNAAQVHVIPSGLDRFLALPYYIASTDRWYAALHAEYHCRGALMNKIPLIKKLKWQAVAGGHYLYQPGFGHWAEATIGIENIFRIIRVDFVFPFREQVYQGFAFRFRVGV